MLPESESYFIATDSAGRESFFEQARNRWTFKPDAKALDDFYAKLRELNPLTIKAQEEGMVYDRGGISLQITTDKKIFNVADAGSSFVVEKDRGRFSDVERLVTDFVELGLEAARIPCTVVMHSELPNAWQGQNSVKFNHKIVLDWAREQPNQYADTVEFQLLPGEYMLSASQMFGEKMHQIDQIVKVDADHDVFHFELKSDTFELKQLQ